MRIRTLLMTGAVAGLALGVGTAAFADSASDQIRAQQAQIDLMRHQIDLMQQNLQQMQTQQQATQQQTAATAEVVAKATPPKGKKGVQIGGVTVTPGGFIEAAGIFRQRNMSSDVGENFNAIPFGNSSNAFLSETRFTARQSRLSLLATGDIDPNTHAAAYYEMDFLGAAGTANTHESNSYNLRIRNIYSTIDWDNLGLHFLGGQSWSLATLYTSGLTPRAEDVPLTIDAQYVVGFNWARQPGFRVTQDLFNKSLWLAVSVENASTTFAGAGPGAAGSQFQSNAFGGGLFDTSTGAVPYSNDAAPDVIAKAAWEPGWGHYEVYGLARFFRDRVNFQNRTDIGGGIGGGAILPIIPKKLEFQLSGLVGQGIGRYGSGQLPDVTFGANGSIHPISEYQLMAGLVGHPSPAWDIYSYAGIEHADNTYQTIGKNNYGYGNPAYSNAGCHMEGSALPCNANSRDIMEATLGVWWKFYQGDFGSLRWGGQYEYIARDVWAGVGGGGTADNNVVMVSFRYYPF